MSEFHANAPTCETGSLTQCEIVPSFARNENMSIPNTESTQPLRADASIAPPDTEQASDTTAVNSDKKTSFAPDSKAMEDRDYVFKLAFTTCCASEQGIKSENDSCFLRNSRKRKTPASEAQHFVSFRTNKRRKCVVKDEYPHCAEASTAKNDSCTPHDSDKGDKKRQDNSKASQIYSSPTSKMTSCPSNATVTAKRPDSCFANNKAHLDYAERRYALSQLWDTPSQENLAHCAKRCLQHQQQPFSVPVYRRGKTPHFEAYWSCPVGPLFAAAAKKMLLKPTTVRDALILGFLRLRQRKHLADELVNATTKLKDTAESKAKPQEENVQVTSSFEEKLDQPVCCSTETKKPITEVPDMPGYTRRHSYVSCDSKVSTAAPLSSSSDSLPSVQPLDFEGNQEVGGVTKLVVSASSSSSDETMGHVNLEAFDQKMPEQEVLASDCRSQNNSLPNGFEASVHDFPTIYQKMLQDVVAQLDHAELNSLFAAFERSDPYGTLYQQLGRCNNTTESVGRNRVARTPFNRFALLTKILALSRMKWLTESLMETDELSTGLTPIPFVDNMDEDPELEDCIRLTLVLTGAQLRLLKLPLQSIIARLHCRRTVRTPPLSPTSGYETRRAHTDHARQQTRRAAGYVTPASTTTATHEAFSGNAEKRRAASTAATCIHTERRQRSCLTTRSRTRNPHVKTQLMEPRKTGQSSSVLATTRTGLSAQSLNYSYPRRAGRPKVNRTGCRCLLCHTLQTPQWRFMPLFGDNWMDLVCNACYMKFNGSRPHYFRFGKPPPFPQLEDLEKPRRPTPEEYRTKGPCAFPHLMRRNDSKQLSLIDSHEHSLSPSSVEPADMLNAKSPTPKPEMVPTTTDDSVVEEPEALAPAAESRAESSLAARSATNVSLPQLKRETLSLSQPEIKRQRLVTKLCNSVVTEPATEDEPLPAPPRIGLKSSTIPRHDTGYNRAMNENNATTSLTTIPPHPSHTAPSRYYYYYCAANAAPPVAPPLAANRFSRFASPQSPATMLPNPLSSYYFPDYTAARDTASGNFPTVPFMGHRESNNGYYPSGPQNTQPPFTSSMSSAFTDVVYDLALQRATSSSWPAIEQETGNETPNNASTRQLPTHTIPRCCSSGAPVTWGVPCVPATAAAAVQLGAPVRQDPAPAECLALEGVLCQSCVRSCMSESRNTPLPSVTLEEDVAITCLERYLKSNPRWRGVQRWHIPELLCSGVLAFHVENVAGFTQLPKLYVICPYFERQLVQVGRLAQLACCCSERLLLALFDEPSKNTSPIFYRISEAFVQSQGRTRN